MIAGWQEKSHRRIQVDVSMNGIELQDREFFAAIREGLEPNASVAQCLPAMQTCDAWTAVGLGGGTVGVAFGDLGGRRPQ